MGGGSFEGETIRKMDEKEVLGTFLNVKHQGDGSKKGSGNFFERKTLRKWTQKWFWGLF